MILNERGRCSSVSERPDRSPVVNTEDRPGRGARVEHPKCRGDGWILSGSSRAWAGDQLEISGAFSGCGTWMEGAEMRFSL